MYASKVVLAVFCLLSLSTASLAQTVAENKPPSEENSTDSGDGSKRPEFGWRFPRGAKEWGFEFGYAPMQPTFFSGRKEYDTDGRRFAMTTFRFGRVIGTVKNVTYEYLFEVMPVAFAINNEVKNPDLKRKPETETLDMPRTVRTTTYGIGIQPAAFRFIFLPRKRVKPFVKLSAGFLFTSKPIPMPGSPNYNFAGDFGGGLMVSLTREKVMSFGYRYFHISNMNIGEINPGYNANMFFVGFSNVRKSR